MTLSRSKSLFAAAALALSATGAMADGLTDGRSSRSIPRSTVSTSKPP